MGKHTLPQFTGDVRYLPRRGRAQHQPMRVGDHFQLERQRGGEVVMHAARMRRRRRQVEHQQLVPGPTRLQLHQHIAQPHPGCAVIGRRVARQQIDLARVGLQSGGAHMHDHRLVLAMLGERGERGKNLRLGVRGSWSLVRGNWQRSAQRGTRTDMDRDKGRRVRRIDPAHQIGEHSLHEQDEPEKQENLPAAQPGETSQTRPRLERIHARYPFCFHANQGFPNRRPTYTAQGPSGTSQPKAAGINWGNGVRSLGRK